MRLIFFSIYLLGLIGSVYSQDKVLVCLHGFMRSKSNMSLFKSSFEQDGWNVYVWYYPSRLKTIEEHGVDLIQLLEFLAKKHPESPICFVTHSMGGLVLRSAVSHPLCPQEGKIGKAVLIAPPNRGSAYGRFLNFFEPFREIAGPYAGRQLMTTELDGFDSLGQFPASMKVLVIAGTCGFNPTIFGPNDGKVGVQETRLSTPHEFKKVFAGHSWICHHAITLGLTKEFLNRIHSVSSDDP